LKYIGWDTETFKIVKHRKATRNSTPKFVCLTWYDGYEKGITKKPKEALDLFIQWIEDPGVTLIAHNAKYDILVMLRLAREGGIDIWERVFKAYSQGRIRDTAVREILIDIARGGKDDRGYALSRLERKYFDRDRSAQKKGDDVWRLRYAELAPWPVDKWPDEAVDYALDDAVGAHDLFFAQLEQAGYDSFEEPLTEQDDQIRNAHFQTTADLPFGLASSWGMSTDPEKAKELDLYYGNIVDDLLARLKTQGIARECGTIDTRSKQEIVLAGWEEVGREPVLTKGGPKKIDKARGAAEKAQSKAEHDAILRDGLIAAVSTSKKDALEPLLKLGYKEPRFQTLMDYNQAMKFRSTYLEPIIDAYPYAVCPGYGVLVDSGRSSSWGPNIQNIPAREKKAAEIRNCFIPRPGNAFIQCDYSSMEMRTLAQVCLNLGFPSKLAESFEKGIDPHLDFACGMMGWSYEWADEIKGDKAHPRHGEIVHERSVSKIANFGFPGGLGAATFVDYAANFGTEITLKKSEELKKAWLEQWPEMNQYFAYMRSQTRYDGKVTIRQHGPYGAIEGWRTRLCDRYTSACNTLFQGLAADAIKLAMWKITIESHTDRDSPLHGFKICAMIHDELIMEGPRDHAEAAAHRLSELMVEGAEVFVPDVPIIAEPEIFWDFWRK